MSQAKNPESHSGRKPNRLINEQSPYLRQHAYNPVDWYAWGSEALDRAKASGTPSCPAAFLILDVNIRSSTTAKITDL